MESSKEQSNEAWKKFLRKHGKAILSFIGAIAVAAIVALYVFLRVVADVQATTPALAMLGQWTVASLFIFVLTVILWELVFVVSWVGPAAAVVYFQWYKKLPEEERKEYEGGSRRGRSSGRDSGFSFFVGLIWLIIVWTNGMWNVAFQLWTIDYLVFSLLAALAWVLLIVGIPGTLYVIWSLRKD